MRRAAQVDRNQASIVHALREAGVSVQHLHTIGHGCPDIVCGVGKKNFLFEIKNPEMSKKGRELTLDETFWHKTWRGQVGIILSAEDALWEMGLK